MGKAKIKPHRREPSIAISPAPISRLKEKIIFSFSYVDFENKNFQMSDNKPEYFTEVINRFKEICRLTLDEFINKNARVFHCHSINWDTATESGFKTAPPELQDARDYQFSISKVKYGRIHGILLDNIFYVVWFDPDHKLSPSQ